jgi:translocation protein SEC62
LKNVPKVTSEEEAAQLLQSVIPFAFFLKVERGQPSGSSSSSPKHLQIVQMQQFNLGTASSDYYAWFYEGSQWTTYAGGVAMVVVMLAGVMFPLWPAVMRLGVWYLSMGVLGLIGLFFVIAILRLIFYIITVIVASPGIWIFPKLFADVGFVSKPRMDGQTVAKKYDVHRWNRSSHSGNGIFPRKKARRRRLTRARARLSKLQLVGQRSKRLPTRVTASQDQRVAQRQ